jgi:putative pyoverdin transport system ATP-binding/permease protein
MRLLLFLGRRSWTLGIGALAAGATSGLCAAALIALINRSLNRPDPWGITLVWGFTGLVLVRVISGGAAQILANYFSQRVLAGLCRDLSRGILAVPLPRLEAIGMPRMLVTLTEEVAVIAWAIQSLPGLAINLAILGGCAVYLAWLSWPIFLGVSGFVAVGTSTFLLLLQPAQRQWRQLWRHRERLVGHLRALIDGMKELKLHAPRREAFLSGSLGDALEAVRQASLHGAIRQAVASAWSQALFFLLVGILAFGMASLREGRSEALTGYLLVAIYMTNPLWSVIDTWPSIARGSLAVEGVMELTSWLDAGSAPASAAQPSTRWERLELKGVIFAYPAENGTKPFQLGPLDFTLQPGEIVFVAGGNGSGKSTFAKVLTGLYPPEAGEIRLDGNLVTETTREWYHGHFSAIFSDFHLFDRLLGLTSPDLDARARAHLARLELDGKVQVENGVFSTTALSSGQRKRLALLTALLEDRPIYVLDEWAADQDPHFRDIFYTALLPELRRRGKAVVVISHDDRYYGLGDRTVRLAYGQVAP